MAKFKRHNEISESQIEDITEADMNPAMLATMRKNYASIKKIDPSSPAYKKLKAMTGKMKEKQLQGLVLADIKWLSQAAGVELKDRFKYSTAQVTALEKRQQESVEEFVVSESADEINEDISKGQMVDLEKFADRLLAKFKIDVEFTRHFGDRANDKRNTPDVKVSELQGIFKKIFKDQAKRVLKHQGGEAVLKDMQADLNLPFILKKKRDGELELVLKTIMRKKNFGTSDPVVQYESDESIDTDIETVNETGDVGSQEPITEFIAKTLSPLIWNKNYKAAIEEVKKQLMDKKSQACTAYFQHT